MHGEVFSPLQVIVTVSILLWPKKSIGSTSIMSKHIHQILSEEIQEQPEITVKDNLIKRFISTRANTESLLHGLTPEDCVLQLADFTSPPKWHLAHTSWFFEELILKKFAKKYRVFDEQFCFLFNSYYNQLGDRIERSHRGALSRPSLQTVFEYRAHISESMINLLEKSDEESEIFNFTELGINHEQQHQELLITDIKYALYQNPLFPVYRRGFDLAGQINNESGTVSINEGVYTVGFRGNGFCYDNELSAHRVFLENAELQKALVTNGEYLEFIEDLGYKRSEFWLDDGWTWINKNQVFAPLYWHKEDGKWYRYSLGGLDTLRNDEILCHVSFYEADAYARWKNMRLPTEFEWEVASRQLPWGQRWEWTNSAYLPYPGFMPPSGPEGEYNGKFMVNQMVLRGSSSATAPGHSRHTYRNFFHPQHQWQCTGIRLAQ